MKTKTVRQILAIALISCALCLMLYYEVKAIAPIAPHSAQTFIGYSQGIEFPVFESELGPMNLQKSWKPRLFSNMLGSLVTQHAVVDGAISGDQIAHLAGLYAAGWLALTFLLYIVFFGGASLIPILGTYAGVAFGYMPGIGDRIYPWDMPPVFFFTLFVCLLLKDKLPYFLIFLPIATLFKETAIVLSVAFLFVEGSAKKRLLLFAAAIALSVGAKFVADVITQSQGRFTLDTRMLQANIRYTLSGEFPHKEWYTWVSRINHPVFINAGLLVAFFLYPFQSRNAWMLRTIVIIFVVGTLFWGVIFEFRIWYELIPILLVPLYQSQLTGKMKPALPTAV